MQLDPIFYCAGILSLGILVQWLAWRIRVPVIVLLLGTGFVIRYLVGPPEAYVPPSLLYPLVSLAVGVILFEGGLSLRLREIRLTGGVVLRLVTVGLLLTWILTGLAAYWILGFSADMAALLGALLTVSGPTVIIPLVRQVQLSQRIGSVIRWEGIVNDPIGAVLAALVFKLTVLDRANVRGTHWLLDLTATLLVGVGLGALAALVIVELLRRYWVPDYLQSPVILAIVVPLFAISNHLQKEAGLISVTLLGVLLANQRIVTLKHIIEFKENLRVLLLAVLFLVLGSNVDLGTAQLSVIGWRIMAFIAVMILVVRPVAVAASTIASPLSWKERVLLAFIHPRGIVAAAVASLLAIELGETNFATEGEQFVLVTFLVIVATVTFYGLLVSPLALRLNLASPNPQGVLFAGASPVVREIASAVQEEGFSVLLVDTNHQNVAAARMANLPVCYASIGSEFVREEADFGDIGRLLAMTPNDEVNTLACMELAERFGRAEVYQLPTSEATHQRRDRVPAYRRGRTLFRKDATYDFIDKRWEEGAVIKKTALTKDFTFDDFRAHYGSSAIVLCIVDDSTKSHRLIINTTEGPKSLRAKQKVIALVDPPPSDNATSS